jgi:FHS family L-fucose permease-like MFS transporter
VVAFLFFLWAIPNNLNDILIRQFMKSFQISRLQAGFVQSAFYLGYFLFSLPAGLILRRFGYRVGLVSGLVLYSTGAFLFWPAAYLDRYGYFLLALFVIAAGLAFLETGAGSFIAQLGDSSTSERRLNLAQAFNPPGTIAGALIGTVFILSGVEPSSQQVDSMKSAGVYQAFLEHETMRVIAPYLMLSGVVLLFAIALLKVRLPPKSYSPQVMQRLEFGNLSDLLRQSHFRQAVIAQFFYVGAQVGTWSYLIQYIQDYTHQPEKIAGYFLSLALVLFAVGRFVSTYLMKHLEPHKLMGAFAIICALLVLVAIVFPGWKGLAALLSVSFFMSLMFPTIFALGLKSLGQNTTLGASFIVMAIIGGAVITPLIGWIAVRSHSMAMALNVVLACFVMVTYFAFIGSRVRGEGKLT